MNEKFSALMDGELPQREIAAVVGELVTSKDQQNAWYEWHAARDALQGQYALSPEFMRQFSARLAAEPIVIAPQQWRTPFLSKKLLVPLSAAASLMFVGLAVWQFSPQALAPQNMAAAPTTLLKAAEVHPYLKMHRDGLAGAMGGEVLAQAPFEVERH